MNIDFRNLCIKFRMVRFLIEILEVLCEFIILYINVNFNVKIFYFLLFNEINILGICIVFILWCDIF